ncbi:MAG: GNAT family N-acetyltransferase [Pyrinomonadaceae bacterium]|nr:GNAT family N-acetyltransferase [Pyrinomonadaceae bacterium]
MSISDEIVVRTATNDDCENVRNLVFGILREYGLEPAPEGIDRDLDDIEANYINRGGLFEVLENKEGKLLGTVGLYPFDEGRIELRKMYFLPEIRGKGLGGKILKRMIEASKKKGYRQIILETASVLKEAIGLYKKFGFIEAHEKHTPRCDQSFYFDLQGKNNE